MSLTSQLEQRDSAVRHFFDARLADADGLKWLRQRYATVQFAVARSAGTALRVPPPPEIDPGARASLLGTAADYRLRLLLTRSCLLERCGSMVLSDTVTVSGMDVVGVAARGPQTTEGDWIGGP